MATRRQIRDTFYDELVAAAAQTFTVTYENGSDTLDVSADDVTVVNPDITESLPAVAYDEDYTRRVVNGVGNAPAAQVYGDDGLLETEQYREYRTATFTVYIAAASEVAKEVIYEAVHRQFGKYQANFVPNSDFHTDVEQVTVEDTSSDDYSGEEAAVRMDTMEVMVDYHRNYDRSEAVALSADTTVENDNNVYEDLSDSV